MPETQNIEVAPATPQDEQSEAPNKSRSRRAAAVEAAYILEAVRK